MAKVMEFHPPAQCSSMRELCQITSKEQNNLKIKILQKLVIDVTSCFCAFIVGLCGIGFTGISMLLTWLLVYQKVENKIVKGRVPAHYTLAWKR